MINSVEPPSQRPSKLKNLMGYRNIVVTVKLYLLLVSIFMFFRCILFITNGSNLKNPSGTIEWLNIFFALVMGLRFDIVISGYLLLIFFIGLSIIDIMNIKSRLVLHILFVYLFIVVSISFVISAADIPYFNQFYSRITLTAFQWIESPIFIIKMILEEPRYYLIVLPLIVVLIVFYKTLKIIFKSYSDSNELKPRPILHILFSLLFLLLMLLGIRGRVEIKSPIRVGTAYFCSNSFLNQAGLNPIFTLVSSYLDRQNPHNKYLNLMNEEEAIKNVQNYFKIEHLLFESPIARLISSKSNSSEKLNVVIIMMESMSAAKMKRFGNKENLTPFLDSLAEQGLSFDNIYTAGIHTYNGVYGSLFSYPALASQHPMKSTNMLKYNGIAYTLKQFDYQTLYFTTHDGQFDNIEGFLYQNDFDKVFTKNDYPQEKILSTLGVPDDYLLEFVNEKLDEFYVQNKPFFAAVLTASDHGPYIIPEYFKPKPNTLTKQIVEYADWSIGKFISAAKTKKWFDKTLFVFVADHGAALSPVYEIPLNYHHSPLIFYAPKILTESKVLYQIGGQIDIFPTIMGILKFPYVNNTFGIDLLNEERPYIYFSADDKYGVLNDSLFLIVNNQGREDLFKYRLNDTKNYMKEYTDLAISMKTYAESNMQTAQYLLKNNKQFITPKNIIFKE